MDAADAADIAADAREAELIPEALEGEGVGRGLGQQPRERLNLFGPAELQRAARAAEKRGRERTARADRMQDP